MEITPVVSQANGVISVYLQATFIGDSTDANDKALIAAFGDPQISLVGNGTFTVGSPPSWNFTFPVSQFFVGITTKMSSNRVRFMLALPSQGGTGGSGSSLYNPNLPAPKQGELDCITPFPSDAAVAWYAAMINEITAAMTALRALSLVPTLAPTTV